MGGPADRKVDRWLFTQLVLLAVAMFGFGFLLVPLYDVFCDLTGLGGKTVTTPAVAEERPDETRSVRVEFVATLGQYAPWEFRPTVMTFDRIAQITAASESEFAAVLARAERRPDPPPCRGSPSPRSR